jgi:methionine sulfoxide reductase heme-binding subunit
MLNFEFNTQNLKLKIAKAVIFTASLIPLALLAYYAYTDNLGANPIEVITHWTGDSTIVLLLITLAVTPLRRVSGRNDAIKFRRLLGLFAFFYACLHFTTYIWLDQFFDFPGMLKDVAKRPFITVGFASFVLLIPLALTSTAGMVRRLGKRWQKLHRLIYLAAAGGVVHYWWLVKKDIRWPLAYGVVLVLLLGFRLALKWPAQRSFAQLFAPSPEKQ